MEEEGVGGGGRSRRYEFGGETNAPPPPPAGLTLGGILSIKQTPPYRIQDRTLLDLIRDDQTCGKESKKTWKMFKEKLRLKLAGSVCTTNLPTLASHVTITTTTTDGHRVTTRQNSTDESRRLNLNSPPVNNTGSDRITLTQAFSVHNETPVEEIEQTTTEEERGGGGDGGPAAARMSLMSLLEVDGSAYLDDDDEEEEVEAVAVAEGGAGAGGGGGGGGYKYNNCCVCMVRHKGAAFIPCGHTFCRLCSRELFVQRASCPLCNNFILEILDIF